jgi:hypothetical protein
MENSIAINIATDFSKNLGGRWKRLGRFSGEAFYEDILKEKYLEAKGKKCRLEIDLDGASPYGSSFVDQSFGELFRQYGNDVKNRVEFKTQYFQWIVDIITQDKWKK